jgi:predicted ATPase
VGVTVDDAGVIHSCIIDSVGAKVAIDAAGAVTSDVTAAPATKNELGENYGMVAYGGAKYEWFQQAAALAEYAVGKTVEELKTGAIDETGKAPAGTDLASTATIYLGGYVSAIEAAVANAQHLGAQAGDELKLAVNNSVGSSKSASTEEAGLAQLDCDVTALTVKDGVITSCTIDSLQAKVNFDATGAITSDLSAPMQTKNQLGENYGMVAWAGAIAEWDEQAASFAAYVTGKTADEVAGIAVNEKTAPTEADLASSVTIAIGGFQGLVAKAMQ